MQRFYECGDIHLVAQPHLFQVVGTGLEVTQVARNAVDVILVRRVVPAEIHDQFCDEERFLAGIFLAVSGQAGFVVPIHHDHVVCLPADPQGIGLRRAVRFGRGAIGGFVGGSAFDGGGGNDALISRDGQIDFERGEIRCTDHRFGGHTVDGRLEQGVVQIIVAVFHNVVGHIGAVGLESELDGRLVGVAGLKAGILFVGVVELAVPHDSFDTDRAFAQQVAIGGFCGRECHFRPLGLGHPRRGDVYGKVDGLDFGFVLDLCCDDRRQQRKQENNR